MAGFAFWMDLAAKAMLVGCLALLGALRMRRSAAGSRHALLLAGLFALLVLPALAILLPKWEVPGLRVPGLGDRSSASKTMPRPGGQALSPDRELGALWAVGAAIVLIRWLNGLRAIRSVSRGAHQPGEEFQVRLRALIPQEGSGKWGRGPQWVLSASHVSPMTWGWWRPTLMLPAEAEAWPDDRLRAVVAHEIAHIHRRDWLTQNLAQIACAFYWWNPAAWLIARGLSRESEQAADDWVIASCCSPEEYAAHLVHVARSMGSNRRITAIAMASRSTLARRLCDVLALGRNRRPMSRRAQQGLFLSFAAMAAAVAAAAPDIRKEETQGTGESRIQAVREVGIRREWRRAATSGPAIAVSARPLQPLAAPTAADWRVAETYSIAHQLPGPKAESKPTQLDTAVTVGVAAHKDHSAPVQAMVSSKVAPAADKAMDTAVAAVRSSQPAAGAQNLIEVPAVDKDTPEVKIDVPAIHVDANEVHVDVPAIHIRIPGVHVHVPGMHVQIPHPPSDNLSDCGAQG